MCSAPAAAASSAPSAQASGSPAASSTSTKRTCQPVLQETCVLVVLQEMCVHIVLCVSHNHAHNSRRALKQLGHWLLGEQTNELEKCIQVLWQSMAT
jgi:hypothetical protein